MKFMNLQTIFYLFAHSSNINMQWPALYVEDLVLYFSQEIRHFWGILCFYSFASGKCLQKVLILKIDCLADIFSPPFLFLLAYFLFYVGWWTPHVFN
jgi:hypothetical protein